MFKSKRSFRSKHNLLWFPFGKDGEWCCHSAKRTDELAVEVGLPQKPLEFLYRG